NTRFTCRTAGVYLVQAVVSWQANVNGSRWMDLKKNGTTMIEERIDSPINAGDSRDFTQELGAIVELAVGDYLELFLTNIGGGALLLTGGPTGRGTKFQMAKIGSPLAGNLGDTSIENEHAVGGAGEPAFQNAWVNNT